MKIPLIIADKSSDLMAQSAFPTHMLIVTFTHPITDYII